MASKKKSRSLARERQAVIAYERRRRLAARKRAGLALDE